MTITVSISEFRQNISHYVSLAQEGYVIVLKNGKKGQNLVEVVKRPKFDLHTFEKALENASGVFTVENHPEWKTKADVSKWLRTERSKADRHFDF